MSNVATQNKRQHVYHPHHLPYTPQCIKINCKEKPYHDGKTYYSLCLGCLQKDELGPFKRRYYKEDYSSLFWLTDIERKLQHDYERKEEYTK